MYPRKRSAFVGDNKSANHKQTKYDNDFYDKSPHRSPARESNRLRRRNNEDYEWIYNYFDYADSRHDTRQVYNFESPSYVYDLYTVSESYEFIPQDLLYDDDKLEPHEMHNRYKKRKGKRNRNLENKHLEKYRNENIINRRRALPPTEPLENGNRQDYNVYISQTSPLRFDQLRNIMRSSYTNSKGRTKVGAKDEKSVEKRFSSGKQRQPQYHVYAAQMEKQNHAKVFNQQLHKENERSFLPVTTNGNYPVLFHQNDISSLTSKHNQSSLSLAYMPVLFLSDNKIGLLTNLNNEQNNNIQDNITQGETDIPLQTSINVYPMMNYAPNIFNQEEASKTTQGNKQEPIIGGGLKKTASEYTLRSYLLAAKNEPGSNVLIPGIQQQEEGVNKMFNETNNSKSRISNTEGNYDKKMSILARNIIEDTSKNVQTGVNKNTKLHEENNTYNPSTFKVLPVGNAMSPESYAKLSAMPKPPSKVRTHLPTLAKFGHILHSKIATIKREPIHVHNDSEAINTKSESEPTANLKTKFSYTKSKPSITTKNKDLGTVSEKSLEREETTKIIDFDIVNNKSLDEGCTLLATNQNVTKWDNTSGEDGTTLVINIRESTPYTDDRFSQIQSERYLTNESYNKSRPSKSSFGGTTSQSRTSQSRTSQSITSQSRTSHSRTENLSGRKESYGATKEKPPLLTTFFRKEEDKDRTTWMDDNTIDPYSETDTGTDNRIAYNQKHLFADAKSVTKTRQTTDHSEQDRSPTSNVCKVVDQNSQRFSTKQTHYVDDSPVMKSNTKSTRITLRYDKINVDLEEKSNLWDGWGKIYFFFFYSFQIAQFIVGVSMHDKFLEITQFLL